MGKQIKCALLTCDDLDGSILDEHFLEQALHDKGYSFQWVQWKDTSVDWDSFDVALIRTTWDYSDYRSQFMEVLEKIEASSCQLLNPLSIVKWNIEKTYLQSLQKQGVAVIPTQWFVWNQRQQIEQEIQALGGDHFVLKPQLSAGAKNTFLFKKEELKTLDQTFEVLENEKVMLQPFMEAVASEGEYSAHFFKNEFSHCVLKTPKDKDFRSQEEFGSFVRAVSLDSQQLQFCKEVLSHIQQPWLYARVDFINGSDKKPNLIELELIEPSLYFRYDEQSAHRLVEALQQMIKSQ